MTSLTTQDITVSAQSTYQRQYSDPFKERFVYAYRIRVQNDSGRSIQLLSRAWEVIDATGGRRFVEGEGVVGQQPLILPGQSYEYTSWVQFETPLGAMRGSYVMQRTDRRGREELIQVEVPRFLHVCPDILN